MDKRCKSKISMQQVLKAVEVESAKIKKKLQEKESDIPEIVKIDRQKAVDLIGLFSLIDRVMNEETAQLKLYSDFVVDIWGVFLLFKWLGVISDWYVGLPIMYAEEVPTVYDNLMLADNLLALNSEDFEFDESDRIVFRLMNCFDELGNMSLNAWCYMMLDRER